MEHIVQFGISIDDEAIRKKIESSAYNDVINRLFGDVKGDIHNKLRSTYGSRPYDALVDVIVKEIIEENKEEIIERASLMVADKITRTKKFREATEKVIQDLLE